LSHPTGTVEIHRDSPDSARIVVKPGPGVFSPRTTWTTSYPDDLLEHVLSVKGTSYMVDEIMRDECRDYVWRALYWGLFSFVPKGDFAGKRILDFGCGGGASTSILARELPDTSFVCVELDADLLSIAEARAAHYGFDDRAELLVSPDPSALPPGIGQFDFISFSAVFEHLLPAERDPLLALVWSALKPGGVMFINQTPNRRSVMEYHTTGGLPFINYLPDRLAGRYARVASKRGLHQMSWEELLRAGLRGASTAEVRRRLVSLCGSEGFDILQPQYEGTHDEVELWHRTTSMLDDRSRTIKGLIKAAARAAGPLYGLVLPSIVMAVRKR